MKNQNRILSMSVAVMLAGGTLSFGQQSESRVQPPTPTQGGTPSQGQVPTPVVDQAMPAAQQSQADQQVRQQLDKIQQQKDNLTGDRLCVLNLALGGQFEVQFAQQAQQKSQNVQVKQIAQRLIQDHQQANQQLMVVAQKLQVDAPTGLTSMKQKELDILGSLDSQTYDKAFIAHNDEHHAHDVEVLKNKSQGAQSPELRQWATKTLPTLQEHWQMIKQTQTAMMTGRQDDAQPAGARIQGITPNNSDTGRPASGQNTPAQGNSASPRSDVGSDKSPTKTNAPGPDERPSAARPPSGQNQSNQNNVNR